MEKDYYCKWQRIKKLLIANQLIVIKKERERERERERIK